MEEKTYTVAASSPASPSPKLEHGREVEGEGEANINASGHIQELDRNFGLWSICGLAICSGNIWIALGGTIVVAINNGGPPGVIYEFMAATVFYCFIAASIAELASAVPSAGGGAYTLFLSLTLPTLPPSFPNPPTHFSYPSTHISYPPTHFPPPTPNRIHPDNITVYHWATITGGKHGRPIGFFAGWLNFLAWIFALASTVQIVAAQTTSMYGVFHPSFTVERWHVFVTYLIWLGLVFLLVLFFNKILPFVESLGGFLVLLGCFISIIVCASMAEHNTSAFVWRDWQNFTGWESDGFVFLLGMLNGAFALGGVDVISHLAEEVPK